MYPTYLKRQNMAKTKKSDLNVDGVLRSSTWPIVAIVSLMLNAALVSTWIYMVNNRQVAIENFLVAHRCVEPGYSKMIASLDQGSKKLAAASLCFTDYQTGRPLDISSLKPLDAGQNDLPAHP
jgi:hypothetical protein